MDTNPDLYYALKVMLSASLAIIVALVLAAFNQLTRRASSDLVNYLRLQWPAVGSGVHHQARIKTSFGRRRVAAQGINADSEVEMNSLTKKKSRSWRLGNRRHAAGEDEDTELGMSDS